MRRAAPLRLVALAAVCLLALAACGAAARPDPPAPPAGAAPTADPREADAGPAAAAVASLDLRELPTLPVSATGERLPTALLYETPAGVAEGVAFYRAELGPRGWRERTDEGYLEERAGLLVLEKDGALLSVSVSDLGDSRVVQLRHYGEVDAGALPIYPGAAILFAQSAQLIYVTPAPVSEVADFSREALARQGWIAYRRPFTAYLEDPALQQLSLTRAGASLTVMVAVAPAQEGRTTVQYVLGLMPVALPLPDDAADLLLDPELPYASYTTSVGEDELVALYRGGMAALGWREGPADGGAALLFLRGEEAADLELSRRPDGRTAVLLSPPGTDVDPASAEVAELQVTPGPAAAPESAALPVPADAYDVGVDPNDGPAGSLRASSPSSVAALLAFYRATLVEQGWAERVDETEGDARRARLVFVRPGELLRLELRQMADGASAIRIATERQ